MAYLVLVRHGESVWNALGQWTGWTDVDLSEKGHEEAREAGNLLKDIHFDAAYTSALKRAQQTFDEIKTVLGQQDLAPTADKALDERNYGDYTGKNKWQVKEQVGEEAFQKLRRSWDSPPPNGESLKMVYERVIPYYEANILPQLKEGKNVIIAAHGNSLRALSKYLQNIPDDKIATFEMPTGQPFVYQIDSEGKVTSTDVRGQKENTV
jgi:2,3-bisphosphoglycerate-dependent phosphoglycerate mutase